MGGGPDERPERYAVADPLLQLPIPAAVRCIHDRGDDRVPLTQSVTYVAAAQAAGQDARLVQGKATTSAWPTPPRPPGRRSSRRSRNWRRAGVPSRTGATGIGRYKKPHSATATESCLGRFGQLPHQRPRPALRAKEVARSVEHVRVVPWKQVSASAIALAGMMMLVLRQSGRPLDHRAGPRVSRRRWRWRTR